MSLLKSRMENEGLVKRRQRVVDKEDTELGEGVNFTLHVFHTQACEKTTWPSLYLKKFMPPVASMQAPIRWSCRQDSHLEWIHTPKNTVIILITHTRGSSDTHSHIIISSTS